MHESEEYADLEIGLYRHDTESYRAELRFRQPADEAEPTPDWGFVRFNLEDLNQVSLDSEAYGRLLTESLFADERVRRGFERAWTAMQAQRLQLRLRLYIDASAPELHSLRWETLRHPLDGSALLTNERVAVSRFGRSADRRPVQLRTRDQLQALVVIASPTDLADYSLAPVPVEAELARARHSLAGIPITPLVRDGERVVRLKHLDEMLRSGYDILYLVGHGALRRTVNGPLEPFLWLEDDDGTAQVVPGTDLVDRLRDMLQPPRLVILASCQSAGQGGVLQVGDDGALAALGPRLVEAGIPAVLAMQGNILVETIAQFMPVFFRELREHGYVDQAVTVARAVVRDRPDWWAPALFMRLKSGLLFTGLPGPATPQPDSKRLREILATRFSRSEIKTLCFDLGIDYEDLEGDTRADLARELVRFLEQRQRLGDLPAWIQANRPDIQL